MAPSVIGQELCKLGLGHFPAGVSELAVLDLAVAAGMTDIGHIVGRIGKSCRCPLSGHQGIKRRPVEQIAAADPVLAANPDVAKPGYRIAGRGVMFQLGRNLDPAKDIDLTDREPGQLEVQPLGLDRRELDLQQIRIPAGIAGDLVIRQAQPPLLRFAEASDRDRR